MPDGDAHGRQLARSSPNAFWIKSYVGADVQIGECFDQPDLKSAEKLADGKTVPSERDDRINGQLTGAVHHASPAAIDPPNFDLPIADQAALHRDFGRRAAPANGNNRGVFAEKQNHLSIATMVRFHNQSLLKLQHPAKSRRAKEKSFQGRRRQSSVEQRCWHGNVRGELEFVERKG
jgi:hypothetical protein